MTKIKALVVRVGEEPRVEEIGTELRDLQALVGGYVQHVPLGNGLGLWCNEDGIEKELPPNRGVLVRGVLAAALGAPAPDAPLDGVHWILGNFFFTRDNEDGDSIDLTDEDVASLRLRLTAPE